MQVGQMEEGQMEEGLVEEVLVEEVLVEVPMEVPVGEVPVGEVPVREVPVEEAQVEMVQVVTATRELPLPTTAGLPVHQIVVELVTLQTHHLLTTAIAVVLILLRTLPNPQFQQLLAVCQLSLNLQRLSLGPKP
jgi:hypothetical protein